MKIISNIQELAIQKNIMSPQELSYDLRVSWPTANQLWHGRIENQRLVTFVKLANVLGCTVNDLFAVENGTNGSPK